MCVAGHNVIITIHGRMDRGVRKSICVIEFIAQWERKKHCQCSKKMQKVQD